MIGDYPLKPKPMKRILPLMVVLCCPLFVFCQDISGLWKGTMYNDDTKQSYQYEVIISKEKGKYIAFSHTWYTIDNQKYFGVKKLNVRIAKDGKIVMQDASLVDNNYPIPAQKDAIQLNVLDMSSQNNETNLDGLFVTNATKGHQALTGKINIKKVNPLITQSDLVDYLHKTNKDSELTVLK